MPQPLTADASPQKEFFIHMLIRDISLKDCILDLIDNCVDGIGNYRQRTRSRRKKGPEKYKGHWIKIHYDTDSIRIVDNCGGIPVDITRDFAFNFGRANTAPKQSDFPIGLYGIGMKRAMFKIGQKISFESSTEKDSLVMEIDLDDWGTSGRWEFPFIADGPKNDIGTIITIRDLHDAIADEFSNPKFSDELHRAIQRDYAFIMDKGLSIQINNKNIKPYEFALLVGEGFMPAKITMSLNGVKTMISAGMATSQPDVVPPGMRLKDLDLSGWFVVCNDRVVLTGDKSHRSGWGTGGVPAWHPQYNGFLGVTSFESADPTKLPWNTTKRDIVEGNKLYQQALVNMRDLTKVFTDYTNVRKGKEKEAKLLEKKSTPTLLGKLRNRKDIKFPEISAEPMDEVVNIHYQKTLEQVKNASRALGLKRVVASTVGNKTFDYFYNRNVGD